MSQSWRTTLFTVRGVPVRLEAGFFLLPLWAAGMGLVANGARLQVALFNLALILLLYGCALLHELGHILPAVGFGSRILQVRVTGLGVSVQVETDGVRRPGQHLIIALGGPLVSALMTVAFTAWAIAGLGSHNLVVAVARLLQHDGLALMVALAATNLLLTVFNLLPVFPMDGGHVLHALLELFFSPAHSTRVVSVFGQVTSIAFTALALLADPGLPVQLIVIGTAVLVFIVSRRQDQLARSFLASSPAV